MRRWIVVASFLGIGSYIGICIVGGVWVGVWLDDVTDKAPLFTILGLFLGLILAFWGVYRMILPVLKNKDNNYRGDN
ncbi:MAG: AtpZ/AtpI family protein [Dehalococcoidia bacterium]